MQLVEKMDMVVAVRVLALMVVSTAEQTEVTLASAMRAGAVAAVVVVVDP